MGTMKRITIILEYLNRYKLAILLGVIVLFMASNMWLSVRNSRARNEVEAEELIKQQKRVEENIVPKILDKKTTDELGDIGGKIW